MNQFLKRSINFLTIPVFILSIMASCDKDMGVMLDNSATGNVGVSFIDSFTVNTSTVQLASLPSAATGTLLVGKASDERFGNVQSSSYFRIGFSTFTNDIPESAVFDSVNLVIKPNVSRYHFGDTTKVQKISVHQLTQTLESTTLTGGIQNTALPIYVTGATIFGHQRFDYSPTAIGSVTFNPRVRSMDSLSIRINQAVGQGFFDLVKANDIRVASNDNFYEYFKGLALVPDAGNTVALGFSDTLQFKLNYSYVGTDGFRRSAAKVMSITDRATQYNNIVHDRENTAFENLSTSNALSTSSTGGLTYVQSGTGVVAKLDFPSLKEFLQDENISVNKAELVIETSSPANTTYPIPGSLMLYVANHEGIPTSFLITPYGSGVQQASYRGASQTGRNATYSFDMIVYAKNLKSSGLYDNTSLYLSSVFPGTAGTFSTFNTAFLAMENAKPKIKLNILYTKFR